MGGYGGIKGKRSSVVAPTLPIGKGIYGKPLPKTVKYPLSAEDVNIVSDVLRWPHPEITPQFLTSIEGSGSFEEFRIPKFNDDSLSRHLCRFKETLLWWEATTEGVVGTARGIFYESCRKGPEFADELDDAIKYSMRESSNCTLLYGGLEWPSSVRNIRSLDQFFSPYHLPPFQRPETDDIDLLFSEPPKIKEDLLNLFKKKVKELIHDPTGQKRELDDIDRLKTLSVSTTFDPDKNIRIAKSIQGAVHPSLKTTKTFTFDYVDVFKAPHESRACVIPSPETLNSLMLLEAQLGQVISSPSDVFREKDFSFLTKWLSFYKHKVYIMSDQKKCGLTFPLELLKVLYLTLEEEFPDWDFGLIRGYFPGYVKRNGKMRPITNGVGLGMMNASISLATSILFEIWKEFQNPDFHLEGLFYNDDQVIRCSYHDVRVSPLHQDVVDMALSWDTHLEDYGLTVHKKKPFIAPSGLFLEIYGEGFPVISTKRTQNLGNLFKSLCACSIAEAKEWFASNYVNLSESHRHEAPLILEKIISYWGYELSPEEVSLPPLLGGWYPRFSEEGLDLTFLTCLDLPFRIERFVNLISVKRRVSQKLPPKWEKYKSRLDTVKKLLKESQLPSCFSWGDYSKMAINAVGNFRISNASRVRREISFLTDRKKALQSKPLTCDQVTKIYWDKVLEEGKAYAIPPSVVRIEENYSSYGTHVEIGSERTDLPDNLLRDYFNLWKMHGYLKDFSFWSPKPAKDSNELLYRIACHVIKNNMRATPRNILFSLILGADQWDKLFHFSLRVYGRYLFPIPSTVKEAGSFLFGSSDLDISYLIDHNLQMVFPIPMEDIEGFEIFRAQRVALDTLNKAIENMPDDEFPNKPIIRDWEELTRLLGPDQILGKPETVLEPQEGFNPERSREEDRNLMVALLSQVRYVSEHVSNEVTLRSGLARTHWYEEPGESEDPWEAEESFGLDFGD